MSVIEIRNLTKRFGDLTAVDDLTFDVQAGKVTGFLGPNGAGKTTTLRSLLGLVHQTSGTATINGRPYAAIRDPVRHVGAVLEASSYHRGRSGINHLRVLCKEGGVPRGKADEMLELVALTDAGRRKAGKYSLGMRQRLALAGALLGDPEVLVLDEPANGLDPEGIAWLRRLLRNLAGQGKAILISSHVLTEVAQTVDDVVIVSRGRLVAAGSLAEVTKDADAPIRVTSPDARVLAERLTATGVEVDAISDGIVRAHHTSAEAVGAAIAQGGIAVHEMVVENPDLEAVFLRLTADPDRLVPDGAAA